MSEYFEQWHYERDTVSLYRDEFPTYKAYLQAYKEAKDYYGYKVRVCGWWKFFNFKQDYDLWRRTK